MRRYRTRFLAVMLASSTVNAAPSRPAAPQEQVGIELHPISVTVTPKNDDLTLCRELTAGSFEVWAADGTVLPIYSVDREGVQTLPSAESLQRFVRGPVFSVFLFDLPSLRNYPLDPSLYPRAFDEVRALLSSPVFTSGFKPELGDAILLGAFDGNRVKNETEWVTNVPEFSAALQALEVRPLIEAPHVDQRNHWLAYEAWANSLADQTVAGRATKNVFLLTADFGLDTDSEIASVFQRARVTINPIDLTALSRKNNLAMGMGTLAWLTSGEVFGGGEAMTNAVEKVIGIYDNGCRLIIYLKAPPDAKLSVHVLDKRFRIPALPPTRPLPPVTSDERFSEMLNRLYSGEGLRLDSVVLPYKPIGRSTWRAFVIVRIRTQPGEKFPESAAGLEVFASLNDGKPPGYVHLEPKDVEALRERGSRLLIFETTVKTGTRSSLAAVTTADVSASATSRTVFKVSKPPKEGESASWNLVGSAGQVAGSTILLPALDTSMSAGKPPVFMGYGCGTQPAGSIVTDATGGVVAAVPLSLESTTTGACGWFLGTPSFKLAPGKYIFKPPQSGAAQDVRFTITEARADAANMPGKRLESSRQ